MNQVTPNQIYSSSATTLTITLDESVDASIILVGTVECTDIVQVSGTYYTCTVLVPDDLGRGFFDLSLVDVSGAITVIPRAIHVITPIILGELGKFFYIGSDYNQENQADSIVEELRVLNKASSDEEMFLDWVLQRKLKLRYQLQDGDATLSEQQSLDIATKAEEIVRQYIKNFDNPLSLDELARVETTQQSLLDRLNLSDQTLLLYHFDHNTETEANVGALALAEKPVISIVASNNDLDITVKYPQGMVIDKELLTDALNKLKPATVQLFITFQEV